MPKLSPSQIARRLGISEKTVIRALWRNDLTDYQIRESGAPLPSRGPRHYLVDLHEAVAYFRQRGIVGHIPPTDDADLIMSLLEEVDLLRAEMQTLRDRAHTEINEEAQRLVDTLTLREHETLIYLAQLPSNKAIAERMSVECSTVKTHLVHIRRKFGVRTSREAVQIASRGGLGREPRTHEVVN